MRRNGLNTFALHTEDEASAEAVRGLREERPGFAAFAVAEAVGLGSLDPETAARQHLQQALVSTAVPQLSAPQIGGAPCEFKSLGSETLSLTGTRYVKFRQTYNKIPVYGSLVSVELDEGNELVALSSALGEPENVDPVAQISPAEALGKARALAGYNGHQSYEATPRIHFYFDPETERWRLVYIVEDVPQRGDAAVGGNGDEPHHGGHVPLLMDYILDAHSGALVAELPRTPSMAGPRQEEAEDGLGKTRRISTLERADENRILRDVGLNVHTHDFAFQDLNLVPLPGGDVVNPPAPWDPGGVSAHANAEVVALFLRDVLQRNGIDNRGGPIRSSVNCVVGSQSPDGIVWRNAAWVGTQMIYGQRRVGSDLRSYAVSLDVVAHEMFHGVTDRTSRLEYAAESGALNESYSDVFGIVISNFEEPDISRWNWELGEELDGSGLPIRDLSDPRKFNQPDHMRDYQNLPVNRENDNGGVHKNSGIHNKAAFNLITAKDQDGAFLFDPVAVAALFYLALTQHLSRTSGFGDSRRAVELVARSLFRRADADARAARLQAIAAAFDATGIR